MSHQTIVFIDTQNVHLGIQSCGWTLDWEKFIVLLQDKFKADKACMFLGYLPEYKWFYKRLETLGYTLYFKTVTRNRHSIKGNVDTHLVLSAAQYYYEQNYKNFILVSGDGDFDVLVEFWKEREVFDRLITPNGANASKLLKQVTTREERYNLAMEKERLAKKDS